MEKSEVADRLARFAPLNQFVTERHGWITVLPDDDEVRLETLPRPTLPDELCALGYEVAILPSAIVEKVRRRC